jgi:hypothetical protein
MFRKVKKLFRSFPPYEKDLKPHPQHCLLQDDTDTILHNLPLRCLHGLVKENEDKRGRGKEERRRVGKRISDEEVKGRTERSTYRVWESRRGFGRE